MPDTSYRPDFAPYASAAFRQTSVPARTHNLPATMNASSSVQSSLIVTEGYTLISVGITLTQNGTLSVQRYLDAGGTVLQGNAVSIPLVANTAANLDVLDGKPFASFQVTVTNSSGTSASLSALAILLQASDQRGSDNTTDGSTTITTAGVAQTLFGGAIPGNGFAIYNPDAVNDLWISDSTTAAVNGLGSIRVFAGGGGFETPALYRPFGPVSVIGAAAGQKITARSW